MTAVSSHNIKFLTPTRTAAATGLQAVVNRDFVYIGPRLL